MKFNYVKEEISGKPKKEWPKRPKLPVALFYGDKKQNMYALVDSGADLCLFNSAIGKLLGIDLESGPLKPIGGISGGIMARMHTIQLQVQGIPERIEIVAGFTDSAGVSGLLGQADFFDNFQVSFERYRWEFDVTPRPQPTRL